MSRTVPSALQTKLDAGATTLTWIWTIQRSDYLSLFYVELDKDLVVNGTTFSSSDGFTASSILSAVASGQQGYEVQVVISDDGINRGDLLGGAWDGARCTIELVDWEEPDLGSILMFAGRIANYKFDERNPDLAVLEARSLLDRNKFISTEVFTSNCRADFGDTRCGVDIDALSKTLTVSSVTNRRQFDSDLSGANTNYKTWGATDFSGGVLIWLTGNNAGRAFEVMWNAPANGEVKLAFTTPFAIQVGDTARIWPGCNKTLERCDEFNNLENFRGEPYMAMEAELIDEGEP